MDIPLYGAKMVTLILASYVIGLSAPVQPPPVPTHPGLLVGRFTIVNPGGKMVAEFKNRNAPTFDMSGPKLTLRSAGLDIDARSAHLEIVGKSVAVGDLTGPIRIVLKGLDQTDTITCALATYRQLDINAPATIEFTGDVKWIHVSPSLEGPAELNGTSGKITLRTGGMGPLIELGSGSFVATPKPPKTPGKKP